MRGNFYTRCFGEVLQQILSFDESILRKIQFNWDLIVSSAHLTPYQYKSATKTLIVQTQLPAIYVQHYTESIKERYNSFFEDQVIEAVRFQKSRL
jgi:hypothetical protein